MSDIDIKEQEDILSIIRGTKPKIKEITPEDLMLLKEGSSADPASIPFPDEEYPQYDLPKPEGSPDDRIKELWQESDMGERFSVARILAYQLEMNEREALRNVDTLTAMIPGTDGDVKKAYKGFSAGWRHAIAQSELNNLSFLEITGQIKPPEVYEAQIAIEKQRLPKAVGIEEIRKQMESEPWKKILRLEKKHEQAIRTYARIDELEKQLLALTPEDARWYMPKYAWSIGAFATQRLLSMREGLVMSMGPTAVGALVGGPPGAGVGFTFGVSAGVYSYWARQMIGAEWRKMIREGIDPKVARWLAIPSGVLQAAAETLQTITPVKGLPGITKALPKALEAAVLTATRNGTLKAIGLNAMKRMGEIGALETLEELTQEQVISTLADYAAIELTNKYNPEKYQLKHQDWVDYLKESAGLIITMFPIGAVMGAPGAGYQFATDVAQMKQEKAIVAGIIEKQPSGKGKLLSEWYPEIEKPVKTEIVEKPEIVKPKEVEPTPVERIEIAKDIEDKPLRTRVMSGEITIQEILEKPWPEEKKVEKAFKKGEKLGIVEERARKKELLKAASERKKLSKYVRRLARKIAVPPPKSVDFEYREAIENLQAGIDPNFRRPKTLDMRERTRKYLEKHPEAEKDIPVKLLKQINQKSINELTISELEEITIEIDKLHKLGRLKRKLELGKEKQELNRDIDRLKTVVLKEKILEPKEKPITKAAVEEGKIKRAYRFVRAMTLRPSRIADKLDGGAKFAGRWHQIFIDEVNQKYDKKLIQTHKRLETGQKKRKELKISLADLTKIKTVLKDGTRVSLDEALDVYAGLKNASKTFAILYGNYFSIEQMEKIADSLTDEEKQFADYIIEDYEKRYSDLRNAHIEYKNEDLGHEEFYTPVRRTELDYSTMHEELADELLRKSHLKKGYTERGFTINRKDIPKEFQKPIYLGLYSTWIDQTAKQENYIAMAKKLRNLHRVLNNKDLTAAIEQQYGKEYHEALRHYVDRTANPTIYRTMHRLEKVSQILRKNTAIAYLSGNVVTMGKQLPSVLLYLADAGPTHLIEAAAEFAAHPIQTIKFVTERDPQVKYRSIERELEELKNYDKAAYNKLMKNISKTGMVGIRAIDKMAVTIGWKGVYNKAIADKKSEQEAIRLAKNATLRTQPAASAKDIAELYATSEYLNWLAMFTNQLNQIYNITTYDIPTDMKRAFKDKDMKALYRGMLEVGGLSMTALMIWSITHRRLPKEKEDFIDAAKEQALNMIPLVGGDILSQSEGYGVRGKFPSIEAIDKMGTWMRDIDWITDHPRYWLDNKKLNNKVNQTLEALAVLFGIPYIGPKRVIKAIKEEDIKEIIGGKPKKRR